MKRMLVLSVFLISFAAGLIAAVPLSFVMRMSDISSANVSWQQARGTVWKGQVTGLELEGQPAGALSLSLRPFDLLRGELGHDLVWSGPAGRGVAQITLSWNAVHLRGGRAEVAVDTSRVSSRLPQHEAVLRISDANMSFQGTDCATGEGQVSTQGLSGISTVYGMGWPELSGVLRCDRGEILVDLSGKADDGASIHVTASLRGGGRMELSDVPATRVEALLLAGFTNQSGKYVFTETGTQNRTQP